MYQALMHHFINCLAGQRLKVVKHTITAEIENSPLRLTASRETPPFSDKCEHCIKNAKMWGTFVGDQQVPARDWKVVPVAKGILCDRTFLVQEAHKEHLAEPSTIIPLLSTITRVGLAEEKDDEYRAIKLSKAFFQALGQTQAAAFFNIDARKRFKAGLRDHNDQSLKVQKGVYVDQLQEVWKVLKSSMFKESIKQR